MNPERHPWNRFSTSIFVVIFLLAIFLRLSLLFTSQSHADADEAVIGIMAKHIQSHHERPFFFHGQAYNGGAAVEAYLASFLFSVLEPSSITLKCVAWALSSLMLLFFMKFANHHLSFPGALISVLLFACAIPLLKWNLKARGGYLEILLLSIYLSDITLRACQKGQWSLDTAALSGLVAGFAYYCLEIVLPLILICILCSFLLLHPRSLRRFSAVFITCLCLGSFPLILFNLKTNLANLATVYANPIRESTSRRPSHLLLVLVHDLPRLFSPENTSLFPDQATLSGWMLTIFFALILLGIAWQVAYRFTKSSSFEWKHRIREQLLPLYVLSVFFAYLCLQAFFSRRDGARTLLICVPFLYLGAGFLFDVVWHNTKRAGRTAFISVIFAIVSFQAGVYMAYLFRPPQVVDVDLAQNGKPQIFFSSPEDLNQAIKILQDSGIRHVYANHFLKFRLLFESDGNILASSKDSWPPGCHFPYYEDQVERVSPYGYVFHRGSWSEKNFFTYAKRKGLSLQMAIAGELSVITRVSEDVRTRPWRTDRDKKE